MSEFLVPIAISSQLDVTGEERIHAAKYTPTVRATYFGLVGDLVNGVVGDVVDYDYTTVNGTGPFFYTVTSGAIPTGLVLDEDTGNLSGTLTEDGEFAWQITVVDSLDNEAVLNDSNEVFVALEITSSLGDGEVGVPYSDTLTIVGGIPPYENLSISTGSLPPGLDESLLSDIITVDGTPT